MDLTEKQDPSNHNHNHRHSSSTSTCPPTLPQTRTHSTATSTTPILPPFLTRHPPASPSTPSPTAPAIDEKNLSLLQACRLFPKAIIWSVILSLTLIMEGYSTILIPSMFALEPFKRQFGSLQDSTTTPSYEIPASWQSAFVNGGLAGQILGLFVAGSLSEKIGYRRTLMVGLVCMGGFISVGFCARGRVVLLVGQCLLGAPWGVFQCVSTVYAVDVCPVGLRGYLTTYVNACWVLGQLLASIVLRSTMHIPSEWSWRLPLGLQWVFPLPILIAVCFAPESPWWLVRQQRIQDAKHNLRRVRTRRKDVETEAMFERKLDAAIEEMMATNKREQEVQSGTRYIDCFRGVDLRRTEIACVCWVIQTLCGSTFMGFSTYFYQQTGIPASHAFTLSLVQFALGLFGVLISWLLMSHYGRRTLYLSGQVLTFMLVLLIGILAAFDHTPSPSTPSSPSSSRHSKIIPHAQSILLLLFTLIYDSTLGPICYTLVSEIPSTRLRSKTVVLARNCYNISGIVTNVITPRMLNPTAWGWGAKSGFFWAGTAAVGVVWSWVRLPETRERTFGELDELFERGVKARRFESTVLEAEE